MAGLILLTSTPKIGAALPKPNPYIAPTVKNGDEAFAMLLDAHKHPEQYEGTSDQTLGAMGAYLFCYDCQKGNGGDTFDSMPSVELVRQVRKTFHDYMKWPVPEE